MWLLTTKNIYFLSFLTLFGCSLSSSNIEVNEIRCGIFESKKIVSFTTSDSPSGNYSYASGTKLKQEGDTILGQIGTKFGVMYQISSDVDEQLLIEKVWTCPQEIINEEGYKFKQVKMESEMKTNTDTYSTYFFEKPYEVVKGEWKFQIFYDGKELYEKKFFVQ